MCQFIVLVSLFNSILLSVFITKESCLVIFSFNISSFLINNFQLLVLVSCQVATCTEIYFWYHILKHHSYSSITFYAKKLAVLHTLNVLTVEKLTNFL